MIATNDTCQTRSSTSAGSLDSVVAIDAAAPQQPVNARVARDHTAAVSAPERKRRRIDGTFRAFENFFSTGAFAAFALCLLFFYQVFVAAMVFAPPVGDGWANFAEDFRIKCFKYDPKTGWMQWNLVWLMLSEPLLIQAIIIAVWRGSLLTMWRTRRRALLPLAGAALIANGGIAAAFGVFAGSRDEQPDLPFPGDRIRSQIEMPAFNLINQDGQDVSLANFDGKIVLFTAVYSTCTSTCPMMLTKVREVLDQLTPAERAQLAVVAFSLNPEHDTRELREMTARTYSMTAPVFHFVSGVPSEVNALLDSLKISRERDANTGEIRHSNLFFLLDRQGKIAFRLSLSERQKSWLVSAVRALLAENKP